MKWFVRQLLRMNGRFIITKRRRIRAFGGEQRQSANSATQTLAVLRSSQSAVPVQSVGTLYTVPLLPIWMRFHSMSCISSPLIRDRCVYRFHLQQRSLFQNVRYAVSVRWNMLYKTYFAPEEVPDVATQIEAPLARNNMQNWLLSWVTSTFTWVSEKLESALVNVGPKSFYINSSASMEVLNLNDIFNDLNYMLIEYLVSHDDLTDTYLFNP